MGAEEITNHRSLIFTYDTLKQGFANYSLLQEFISTGDTPFLGTYSTVDCLPLVCGHYNVPFLLNLLGSVHHVLGELYDVSNWVLLRMDELERSSCRHYERLPLKVEAMEGGGGVVVEAYYGHWSYTERMWKRNGEKGLRKICERGVFLGL